MHANIEQHQIGEFFFPSKLKLNIDFDANANKIEYHRLIEKKIPKICF